MTAVNYVLTLLGSTGLSAGAVFLLLKAFPEKAAEKLIGHVFDRRIEALRHNYTTQLEGLKQTYAREVEDLRHSKTQDIEHLRVDLSRLTDRGTRSNEREYEAIILVWESFVEAFNLTRVCCGGLRTYPNLNDMSSDDLSEFLDSVGVAGRTKADIMEAQDPLRAYSRLLTAKEIDEAGRAVADFRSVLRRKGVFIPDTLFGEFERVAQIVRTVWANRHSNFNTPVALRPKESGRQAVDFMTQRGDELFDDMLRLVRDRVLRADSIVRLEGRSTSRMLAPEDEHLAPGTSG